MDGSGDPYPLSSSESEKEEPVFEVIMESASESDDGFQDELPPPSCVLPDCDVLHDEVPVMAASSSGYGGKVSKLERDYQEMVKALDGATSRMQGLESQIDVANVVINDLQRELYAQQKRGDKVKERDAIIVKLEEEKRVVQEQLKLKTQEVKHLEEAHQKVHDNFQRLMIESEKEIVKLKEEKRIVEEQLGQVKHLEEAQDEVHYNFQTSMIGSEKEKSDMKFTMRHMVHQTQEAIGKLRCSLAKAKERQSKKMKRKAKEKQGKKMKRRGTPLEQNDKMVLKLLKAFQET